MPMSTGRLPTSPARIASIRSRDRAVSAAPPAGAAAVASALGGAHASASSVDGIPETFVGTPAVIAPTISCCVVFARS